MTLRWKELYAIGGLVGLGYLLVIILSNSILLRGFSTLQQEQVQQHRLQADSALNAEVAELQRTPLDWSSWDDSYQFILDRNENYLQSNLLDATFEDLGLRLNAILFLNSAGDVGFSRGYDFVNDRAIALPGGLLERFSNPAQALPAPAELLARTVTGEKETKLLDIIRHSGAKAARLVDQLNQVVRPHNRSNDQSIDVNKTVREALQIAEPRWRDEAQLRGVKIRVIDDLYTVSSIRGNEIATILLSGWQLPENDVRQSGVGRYVVKPVNSADQIIAVIEEALGSDLHPS